MNDDDYALHKDQYARLRAALRREGEDPDRALWDDDLGIGIDDTEPIDRDLVTRLLQEAGIIEDPNVVDDLQALLVELS